MNKENPDGALRLIAGHFQSKDAVKDVAAEKVV
jgi:hypothetical protein